jgi:RNA polymerase sigma-70 factor (ECF subfamily)
MESEEAIIRSCIEGDKQSYKKLYDAYSSKMMAVSMRYFPNRINAEDVLHNAWLKIFEKIESFRGDGSLEGWMKRIVANEAINEIRRINKQGKWLSFDDSLYENAVNQTSDNFLEEEDVGHFHLSAEQLLDALHELPEGYRTIFNLYVFEKMKHQEIAKLLGISKNTSKSQLHKARLLLRKSLSKNFVDDVCKIVNEKTIDNQKNLDTLISERHMGRETIKIVAINLKNCD